MLTLHILAGVHQAILELPLDGKPVDIDSANARKEAELAERNRNIGSSEELSEATDRIAVLPELKALDPDLVKEVLKKERRVRRKLQ